MKWDRITSTSTKPKVREKRESENSTNCQQNSAKLYELEKNEIPHEVEQNKFYFNQTKRERERK